MKKRCSFIVIIIHYLQEQVKPIARFSVKNDCFLSKTGENKMSFLEI